MSLDYQPPNRCQHGEPKDRCLPCETFDLRAALQKAEERAEKLDNGVLEWMQAHEDARTELAAERQTRERAESDLRIAQERIATLKTGRGRFLERAERAESERDALRAECERLKAALKGALDEVADQIQQKQALLRDDTAATLRATLAEREAELKQLKEYTGGLERLTVGHVYVPNEEYAKLCEDLRQARERSLEREAEIERLKAEMVEQIKETERIERYVMFEHPAVKERDEARAALGKEQSQLEDALWKAAENAAAKARREALEEAAKVAEAKGRASFEREVGWACAEIANAIRALATSDDAGGGG